MNDRRQLKTVYQCVCCNYETDKPVRKCPKCGATMTPIVKVQKKLT